jgi:predicted  nucleic acid-binding Zn-ribbon protein
VFSLYVSHRNSQKEIKKLVHEVSQVTDSLQKIHAVYISLETEYAIIYNKMDSTRIRFNSFRSRLDSVAHTNMSNITRINREIKRMIDNEKVIAPFVNVTDTFRFK